MPEGPEVHNQADALHAFLKGQIVTKIRFRSGWTDRKKMDPDADNLIDNLPLRVIKVWAKGKKIIIRFKGYSYMVVYLGMEGRWSYVPLKYSYIYIETQEGNRVWYDDKRYLGNFEFYNSTKELNSRMSKIGPDLISDDISIKDWLSVTTSPKVSNKQISQFLMDQKYFSGVGNYVKAEVLYAARIRPDALLGDLTAEMLTRLFQVIRRIIQKSYAAQGASLHSYINADGNKGNFRVVVYDATEDPQGNPVIRSIFQDDRVTHWVPTVQVLPTPWKGYSRLSVKKLRSTSGSAGYTCWELRSFCLQRQVATEGTKGVMVKRLLTTL